MAAMMTPALPTEVLQPSGLKQLQTTVTSFARFNERTTQPSRRINFYSVHEGEAEPDLALQKLHALASFLEPIMDSEGITVNLLSTIPRGLPYIGRNVGRGCEIELVVRRQDGQWLPDLTLLVLAIHEIAHFYTDGHGPVFRKAFQMLATKASRLLEYGFFGQAPFAMNIPTTASTFGGAFVVSSTEAAEMLCGSRSSRSSRSSSTPSSASAPRPPRPAASSTASSASLQPSSASGAPPRKTCGKKRNWTKTTGEGEVLGGGLGDSAEAGRVASSLLDRDRRLQAAEKRQKRCEVLVVE